MPKGRRNKKEDHESCRVPGFYMAISPLAHRIVNWASDRPIDPRNVGSMQAVAANAAVLAAAMTATASTTETIHCGPCQCSSLLEGACGSRIHCPYRHMYMARHS